MDTVQRFECGRADSQCWFHRNLPICAARRLECPVCPIRNRNNRPGCSAVSGPSQPGSDPDLLLNPGVGFEPNNHRLWVIICQNVILTVKTFCFKMEETEHQSQIKLVHIVSFIGQRGRENENEKGKFCFRRLRQVERNDGPDQENGHQYHRSKRGRADRH